MTYQLKAIGKVKNDETGTFIQLEPEYIPGLQALKGFSHINVLWWFSDCDNDADRNELQTEQPYEGCLLYTSAPCMSVSKADGNRGLFFRQATGSKQQWQTGAGGRILLLREEGLLGHPVSIRQKIS